MKKKESMKVVDKKNAIDGILCIDQKSLNEIVSFSVMESFPYIENDIASLKRDNKLLCVLVILSIVSQIGLIAYIKFGLGL